MRICKVWDAEYPWDVRVEKVARALTDAGHDVHLVARNRRGDPVMERFPECTVHRLRPLHLGARLDAVSMFPAFFNPRWASHILGTARRIEADLVLVRDIPLAPTAIWAARRLGVPAVVDMAENYPAMMRELWAHGNARALDVIVRNPRAVEWVERWSLARADHVLTVVEESRERVIGLGVPASRVSVVGNTPPLARLRELGPGDGVSPHTSVAGRRLDLVYLGLLEASRGIHTMLDAMALARDRGLPVRLTIMGDGREGTEHRAQAERLRLGPDDVRFAGFVPYEEALRRLRNADAGVVPHLANEFWNSTIPNKLFDYMAAGVPVLASDALPVRRVVESTGCGDVFVAGDAASAVEAIGRLRDDERLARYSAAGRAAVAGIYHWEHDAARLLRIVEHLHGSLAPPHA